MSDADTFKVGDPNPAWEGAGCLERLSQPGVPPYYCVRGSGHTGQHVAGSMNHGVVATWTGDGSDYQELAHQ